MREVIKKGIVLIVAVLFTTALFSGGEYSGSEVKAADGSAVWDGVTRDKSWYNIYDEEFTIHTAAEFAGLIEITNVNAYTFLSINSGEQQVIKLGQDIWLNTDENPEANVWKSVGISIIEFLGILDGQGHTIHNLYIDGTESPAQYQGLFGYIGDKGGVKNLHVEGKVSGGSFSNGMIAGMSSGFIENCTAKGSVEGTTYYTGGIVGYCRETNALVVKDCKSECTVTGDNYVGGIAGKTSVTTEVENCINSGVVNGNKYCGGISGMNDGNISGSSNSGKITGTTQSTGGISGYVLAGAVLSGNSNTGAVSCPAYTGGIAGAQQGTAADIPSVVDCTNSGSVEGDKNIGGISGISNGSVSRCTNEGTITGTISGQFIAGISGGVKTGMRVDSCTNTGNVNGLKYTGGIAGICRGPVEDCVNNGQVTGGSQSTGGIAGYMSVDASLADCTNKGSVAGEDYVGGVVGSGNKLIERCQNSGGVSGYANVGGIVGIALVDTETNTSVNSGSVSGDSYCGGVIGSNKGTLKESYNTGEVRIGLKGGGVVGHNVGTVTACYNTGDIIGVVSEGKDLLLGGVVGTNKNAVTDCYSSGRTLAEGDIQRLTAGGVIGSICDEFVESSGVVYNSVQKNSYYNIDTAGDAVHAAVGCKFTGETSVSFDIPDTEFLRGLSCWDMSGKDALNQMVFQNPSVWKVNEDEQPGYFYFPQLNHYAPSQPQDYPRIGFYQISLIGDSYYAIQAAAGYDLQGRVLEGNDFKVVITPKDGYLQENLVVKQEGTELVPEGEDRNIYTLKEVRADQTLTVTVKKLAPKVKFPESAVIKKGQKLSEAVLTGGAGDGTFAFADADLRPDADGNYLMRFTPADSKIYAAAEKEVLVNIESAAAGLGSDTDGDGSTDNIPNTGDGQNPALALALCAICGFVFLNRRKRNPGESDL